MDRLSDHRWRWSGSWDADGKQCIRTSMKSNAHKKLQPIVAIQNVLPQKDVSIGMSLLVFSQNLGGALFLSFDETAFSNGLDQAIPKFTPGVNPQVVINAGATGFRAVIPESAVPGILKAYSQALSHVFYIAAATAAASLLFGLGMGNKNIKKAKQTIEDQRKIPLKKSEVV